MSSSRRATKAYPLRNAFLLSLVGLAVQLFFLRHMDVEPLFGPGGVKSIAALTEDYPQRDWGTWLMHWFLPLAENKADIAARLTVLTGSMATIFGTSLAGTSLSDERSGRWLGLFLACYAPVIWNSLLIGPDAIATGIIWLGIGLAYYGATKHWFWAILCALFGAFSCIFAAKIKITALPATTFIGILPLLAMKPGFLGKLRGLFIGSICLLGLLWLRENWMSSSGAPVSTPSLTQSTLEHGWRQLQKIGDEESVIVQLAVIASVGILLPLRNIFSKICLAALCVIALLLTASTLGEKIRPRYFVPTSLPIFILLSALFSQTRYRILGYIQNSAGIIIAVFLFLDSLAYHSEWSKLMHRYSGTELSTLPKTPKGWSDRYLRFSRLDHDDHSTSGAKRLHQLSVEAPTETVLGVPLRDGRDFHLKASAQISGHKAIILSSQFCCEQQTDLKRCAEETVEQLSKASARLIIPIVKTDHARIPNHSQNWYRYLLQAARSQKNFTEERQWGYLDASGDKPPPCQRPTRRKKGLWEIDGERKNHSQRRHQSNQAPKQKHQN